MTANGVHAWRLVVAVTQRRSHETHWFLVRGVKRALDDDRREQDIPM